MKPVKKSLSREGRAAVWMARQGLRVFPLFPGKKTPGVKDWDDVATSDPARVGRWWGRPFYDSSGIGVATGKMSDGRWLVVLDVDVPSEGHASEADGREVLAALEAEHGPLPETVTVETGSGGLHFWFVSDREVRNSQNAYLAEGIDIRGQGGYVVAPPSSHPSGTSYRWVKGRGLDDVEIAALPGWVDSMLAAKAAEAAAARVARVGTPTSRERADVGERPGDVFEANTSWAELLEADGWTFAGTAGGSDRWAKPGKDPGRGHSATTGHGDADVLHVFSTKVAPLVAGQSYSRFGYWAMTAHGGDFKAAAVAAAERFGLTRKGPDDMNMDWTRFWQEEGHVNWPALAATYERRLGLAGVEQGSNVWTMRGGDLLDAVGDLIARADNGATITETEFRSALSVLEREAQIRELVPSVEEAPSVEVPVDAEARAQEAAFAAMDRAVSEMGLTGVEPGSPEWRAAGGGVIDRVQNLVIGTVSRPDLGVTELAYATRRLEAILAVPGMARWLGTVDEIMEGRPGVSGGESRELATAYGQLAWAAAQVLRDAGSVSLRVDMAAAQRAVGAVVAAEAGLDASEISDQYIAPPQFALSERHWEGAGRLVQDAFAGADMLFDLPPAEASFRAVMQNYAHSLIGDEADFDIAAFPEARLMEVVEAIGHGAAEMAGAAGYEPETRSTGELPILSAALWKFRRDSEVSGMNLAYVAPGSPQGVLGGMRDVEEMDRLVSVLEAGPSDDPDGYEAAAEQVGAVWWHIDYTRGSSEGTTNHHLDEMQDTARLSRGQDPIAVTVRVARSFLSRTEGNVEDWGIERLSRALSGMAGPVALSGMAALADPSPENTGRFLAVAVSDDPARIAANPELVEDLWVAASDGVPVEEAPLAEITENLSKGAAFVRGVPHRAERDEAENVVLEWLAVGGQWHRDAFAVSLERGSDDPMLWDSDWETALHRPSLSATVTSERLVDAVFEAAAEQGEDVSESWCAGFADGYEGFESACPPHLVAAEYVAGWSGGIAACPTAWRGRDLDVSVEEPDVDVDVDEVEQDVPSRKGSRLLRALDAVAAADGPKPGSKTVTGALLAGALGDDAPRPTAPSTWSAIADAAKARYLASRAKSASADEVQALIKDVGAGVSYGAMDADVEPWSALYAVVGDGGNVWVEDDGMLLVGNGEMEGTMWLDPESGVALGRQQFESELGVELPNDVIDQVAARMRAQAREHGAVFGESDAMLAAPADAQAEVFSLAQRVADSDPKARPLAAVLTTSGKWFEAVGRAAEHGKVAPAVASVRKAASAAQEMIAARREYVDPTINDAVAAERRATVSV